MNLTLEQRVTKLEALLGLRAATNAPALEKLLEIVASAYLLTPRDLRSHRRTMHIVLPRQVFFYVARQIPMSLQTIGRCTGHDHGTVIHACASVEDRLDTDRDFRARLQQIAALAQIQLPQRYALESQAEVGK